LILFIHAQYGIVGCRLSYHITIVSRGDEPFTILPDKDDGRDIVFITLFVSAVINAIGRVECPDVCYPVHNGHVIGHKTQLTAFVNRTRIFKKALINA
jgi:hypothetical protein